MKLPTKAQFKKMNKELDKQLGREVVHLGKYAAKEYAKIGAGIADELGFFLTGVKASNPKRRR